MRFKLLGFTFEFDDALDPPRAVDGPPGADLDRLQDNLSSLVTIAKEAMITGAPQEHRVYLDGDQSREAFLQIAPPDDAGECRMYVDGMLWFHDPRRDRPGASGGDFDLN